jgi:pimeloyl-ACP methyl ester carboxylesterase
MNHQNKPVSPNSEQGQIAQANGIEIWYETFGSSKDPAFLLLAGGGGYCQGVLWPVNFCERLAKEGFYVIRYDNRDAGLSTCLDFDKNPYTLLDITKDTVGLLDALKIEKAHFFGLSMGGLVAKIIAAHYPERVHSISFTGSTCDVEPMNRAIKGLPPKEGALSSPSEGYLSYIKQASSTSCDSDKEKIQKNVDAWHLLSGSKAPFDKNLYHSLFKECISRTKRSDVFMNHFFASTLSEDMVRSVPPLIKVPTLIIQGSEDPLFGPDHGEALAKMIQTSTYMLVEGLGHAPSSYFDDFFVEELTKHAKINT